MNRITSTVALVVLGLTAATSPAAPPVPVAEPVAEPGWVGVIIARGELRDQIESTPILERPYRPLHFYGNTVRRNHYRGAPIPKLKDVVQGAGSIVTNR